MAPLVRQYQGDGALVRHDMETERMCNPSFTTVQLGQTKRRLWVLPDTQQKPKPLIYSVTPILSRHGACLGTGR